MYIANTATTSENRKVTPSFSSQGGLTEKNMNTSYKFPFAKSHSTVMPSRETSNPLDNEIAKRKMYNVRFIKNKKEDFVVFRPYNFTVEKVSSDAIRIRWQRNKKKSVGPVATFSIKVLPYRTQQSFEAHITDLTNNHHSTRFVSGLSIQSCRHTRRCYSSKQIYICGTKQSSQGQ
ncbi:unnamed protein product [Lepeophtheirus salmonis]|uniref:(salmon louse) hypothetical protein n=1 Tax=Lepeophtheirus salmonis TaxID=72036 RepID=A0A7R8CHK5_LEPSM|nr:unnamed protein product [Lepeophtheirus salmonis]CAF2824814.1 unnamed protein product [Lepeophtheirus salmonis]